MKLLLVFLVFFVSYLSARAEELENDKKPDPAMIKQFLGLCQKNVGASDSDVEEIANGSKPTTPKGKCLLACFAEPMLNDDGSLSRDKMTIVMEMVDEEKKEKLEKLADACSDKVFDTEACENAFQIWSCFEDAAMKAMESE